MWEYSGGHAALRSLRQPGRSRRPPLQKIRLSLGADGANQNGVAAEGSCDTRPFSGEWLQSLGVAL
jgi:hypothetical protein